MIGTILGRLGKDAEVTVTSGGTQYVKFTLAENVYRNGKDETVWYDIVSYDPFVAKTQVKVLRKGSFAIVVGDVDTKVNVAKNGSIYINQHITASSIKVPYLGNNGNVNTTTPPKIEEPESDIVDTQPKMSITMPTFENTSKQNKKTVKSEPIIQPDEILNGDGEDDLPF